MEERQPNVTAEQILAQRLAALKAEEERKATENAEQERLSRIKIEQENEAARQAAIQNELEQLAARAEESRKATEIAEQARIDKEKLELEKIAAEAAQLAAIKREQEQLENRKAENSRKAAEEAEQERIAALKADEERLAAAKKKLLESAEPGIEALSPQIPSAGSSSHPDPSITGSEVPPPETIWNLYVSAKANDPVLARSQARASGSKADSDLVFSGLMPHLDSSAGFKQISQTLMNYNTPNDIRYAYSSINYDVTARLTLLHVPTLYALSAAAAALNGELAGVAAARQNLIVKFTDSYFSLLKAQTDKQIALGELYRLKQVLDQANAFFKAGTGDIISVYEAQSRLDGAKADLAKSESSLRLAEQKLSSLTGKPVSSVVNYLPQLPNGPDPDNIDWWVATMEKEQPVIRQAREGLAQTSDQLKAAKSEYLPVIQASGGYDVSRGTADLPTAEVRQWFIGASISLPLYSGGETAAKVRRAVATDDERRHSFDETLDQQRENVKQAFFNLRYNISLIKALEQKKASAEIQLAAIQKGRKIGTRNAIDVLNAEQTYSIALRDHTYALYDNIIRFIQLKSAAGILAEADVSELSSLTAPTMISKLNMLVSHAIK
jgi:outer membrane protein